MRFQRFQQYLQGTCHIRSVDLRKIFQHRRCCGRIGNQPFAQSRRIFRDMPEHVLWGAGTARHQRRQRNRGRWRVDQRFWPWLGLVWRRFAACAIRMAMRAIPCMPSRCPVRFAAFTRLAFFKDSERPAGSVEVVRLVRASHVTFARFDPAVLMCFASAVRLVPAMRRAHIQRPYGPYGLRNPYGSRVRNLCRQSQECNSVPAERCEYASYLP